MTLNQNHILRHRSIDRAADHNLSLSSPLQRPIRILQVVGGMHRGGIETWLMWILRQINRDRFQMDFLVHTEQSYAYDAEIRSLGCQIIPCLHPSNPLQYAKNFRQILQVQPPYDIIHSHVHHFSGYVLYLAQQAGVPSRIAHSHLNSQPSEAEASWYRRLYLATSRYWINRYATLGLGCSELAMTDLFGSDWQSHPARQLLYYGIDLAPFQQSIAPRIGHLDPAPTQAAQVRLRMRTELGIPAAAFVVGHVGRFEPQKNHQFILQIAAEVVAREPNAYFLFVGEGRLHPAIEQQAMTLGIADRCIFIGGRSDVPQLMCSVMDLFLFPSLYEGLGIVLLEAQTAGLPCVFSDVVPQEVDVVKPLLHRRSLSQPASVWAETVLSQQYGSPLTQAEAFATLAASPFKIETSLQQIEALYQVQTNPTQLNPIQPKPLQTNPGVAV